MLRDNRMAVLPAGVLLARRGGVACAIAGDADPIRDRTGRTVGVVLVFRDLTERRAIERDQADVLARERTARRDAAASGEAFAQHALGFLPLPGQGEGDREVVHERERLLVVGPEHALRALAFLVALFSLLSAGAVLSWAPPADMPLWLAVVVLCIAYAAIATPLAHLRRSSYGAASGYSFAGGGADGAITLVAIIAGAALKVVAIDGVTLEVEPEEGAARDYRERRAKQ